MARTLPLGLAAALGAALLVPLAPGLANAAPVEAKSAGYCPASSLNADQLADLLADVDAATQAKATAARGYRLVMKVPEWDFTNVVVGDLGRDRTESTTVVTDQGTERIKSLSNGYSYGLVTTSSGAQAKAALGVLHRSSIWVNQGKTDPEQIALPDFEDTDATSGTCTDTASGATITTAGTDAMTIKVDTSLALTRVQVEDDGTMTATMAYAAQYVTDIPGTARISDSSWEKANTSATQRAKLVSWAHTTADKAKSIANKAGHTVRASDIQTAARKWPLSNTVRTNISSGVVVTSKAKDVYTGKSLSVKLTASDKTVKIAHNW